MRDQCAESVPWDRVGFRKGKEVDERWRSSMGRASKERKQREGVREQDGLVPRDENENEN